VASVEKEVIVRSRDYFIQLPLAMYHCQVYLKQISCMQSMSGVK